MPRILTAAAAATALLACAIPAAAQDAGGWSFAVGAGTDNRSKDISKTNGEAFVWGEAEWESASGMVYFGPGFQTIESGGSELELTVGAGLRPQAAGFDFDLNVSLKHQVDATPGTDDSAWEFTADAMRSIGPASGRLRLQHSPDGTGATEAWTWVEARAGWAFTNTVEGTVAVGRREQDNNVDYTGWNAGVAWSLARNVELDLRYHDNDAGVPTEQYQSALVAGISLFF